MSLSYRLPPGYRIETIETTAFAKLWQKPGQRIFNNACLFYDHSSVYSKKDLNAFKKLRKDFNSDKAERINLALYHKDQFVGWSWGFQETATVFYMCNSAILENHREKGLYTCLMREMLKRAIHRGYDRIYSRHILVNNDILIAKMKQGFKITGFELSEAFGTMAILSYYPSKIKNDILDFRSGFKRPNNKIKKLFQL